MKQRVLFIIMYFLLPTFLYAAKPPQTEKIQNFSSLIQVNKDATLNVTENILVYADKQKIIHGLIRSLPTQYIDNQGKTNHVRYQIIKVLLNNKPEPFYIENFYDRIGIYIGDRNTTIPTGFYTYTIQYQVTGAVHFFGQQDTLFWNISGHDWSFPVLKAEGIIELPEGTPISQYVALTGKTGANTANFSTQFTPSSHRIVFTTQQPLQKGEGLSAMISWPKGTVANPTFADRMKLDFEADKVKYMLFEIYFLILFYYLFIWYFFSRDLRKEIPISRSTPPLNLSPAATRFISRMGFDTDVFTAAIFSMVAKDFITIQQQEGDYTLTLKNNDLNLLTPEEKCIAQELFSNNSTFNFSSHNSSQIQTAKNYLKQSLSIQFKNLYFVKNFLYLIPAILLTLFAFIIAILASSDQVSAFFSIVWLVVWTFACSIFVSLSAKAIEHSISFRDSIHIRRAIVSILIAIPFLVGEITGILAIVTTHTLPVMSMLALFLIVVFNLIFFHYLKIPTRKGKKVMDQIDGFKQFLSTHPSQEYFPYSIALDINKTAPHLDANSTPSSSYANNFSYHLNYILLASSSFKDESSRPPAQSNGGGNGW